ncbi:hypothetical protein T439DRAFT_64189 [Meredithblackwellia eburnea MCA 4105]
MTIGSGATRRALNPEGARRFVHEYMFKRGFYPPRTPLLKKDWYSAYVSDTAPPVSALAPALTRLSPASPSKRSSGQANQDQPPRRIPSPPKPAQRPGSPTPFRQLGQAKDSSTESSTSSSSTTSLTAPPPPNFHPISSTSLVTSQAPPTPPPTNGTTENDVPAPAEERYDLPARRTKCGVNAAMRALRDAEARSVGNAQQGGTGTHSTSCLHSK